LHAMSAGPKELVCCVWLDLRNSQTEVMASVSSDGGKTWNTNTLVYRSPDGSVCECCHPSVAIDALGRIFVQWRNSLAGARDMFVAFSADGGDTFSEAAKQGSGSWLLAACPMDGGAICTPAPGKTAAVWRRENAVYLWFEGERDERRLGIGEQPWIAAAANGLYVVWLRERGNAALLLSPGASSPAELAVNASDPVIASRPDGRGPVVVVWEVHEGNEYTIRCQVVANIK